MFNKKVKKIILKVLISIVYFIPENYVCVDYLCCPKNKLHVTNKWQGFENRTYNAVPGIIMTELLINIISCHRFFNDKNSAVIFSCRRKLVDYYLQKYIFSWKHPKLL